jgi:hypothetical protein
MAGPYSELIIYLRRKAVQYSQMADFLELEFSDDPEHIEARNRLAHGFPIYATGSFPLSTKIRPNTVELPTGEVTAEKVQTFLQIKKARVRDLAEHFSCPEHVIESIVKNPENKIETGDRGWLSYEPHRGVYNFAGGGFSIPVPPLPSMPPMPPTDVKLPDFSGIWPCSKEKKNEPDGS